ncbi:MAG: hypothetical protein ACYC6N_20990 [Pirellulaceae bacterium]
MNRISFVMNQSQERPTTLPLSGYALILIWLGFAFAPCSAAETPDWYYHEGPLRGSLKSDSSLPLYDSDPAHLWNRLFAAFYIRPSDLPSRPEYPQDSTRLDEWDRKLRAGELPTGPVVKRFEGGDTMSFLAWPRTRYYSEPGTFARADKLLEEFITTHAERLIDDPLKRAFLQRDLWAVFDHLVGQNIARFGDGDLVRRGALNRDVYGIEADEAPFDDPEAIERRGILCRKLAAIIQRLALPAAVIQTLPDTYAEAIRCGYFASRHDFDGQSNYLPPRLLTDPDEWVEIDTASESLPHFQEEGQINYVVWSIRGRSYYRIFWRFPGGRKAVEEYLKYLGEEGVDWEKTARQGHVALKPDVRQIPAGTEAAIVQFMIVLDDRLVPVPTRLVESLRVSVYKNVDGTPDPATNTGLGMIGRVYGAQRRLLFDNLKHGGLARAPDDAPTYQVLLSGHEDWGHWGRQQAVIQTCVHCHMHRKETRGVFSLNSIFCFEPDGGMPGIVIPMGFGDIQTYPRPQRVARWKQRQEDYLRLVEYARAEPAARERAIGGD